MDTYRSFVVLSLFVTVGITHSMEAMRYSGTKDFCLNEGFQATCRDDEVVVIASARYGRMRLSTCVTRDYGFVGCGNDVTRLLTTLCSGKRDCRISNLESIFAGPQSCPDDLKPYLEASWHCVKVVQAKPDLCSYGYLPVPSTSGYIASVATQEHDIGSSRCPWVIKVHPGQRINVTLLDFGLTADLQGESVTGSAAVAPQGKPTHPRYCREYATLRETKSVRTVVVCDGDPVQKHMYVSDDHVVEIEVAKSEASGVQFRFLLKYEVVGCPLPEAPLNAHIEGSGGQVYIRCNFTSDYWLLVCSKGQWTGFVGNCTQVISKSAGHKTQSGFLPLGMTVVIIVGVAIFICLFTLIIGLLHLRRKRRAEKARKEDTLLYGLARGRDLKLEQQRFVSSLDPSKPYSPMGGCVRTSTGGEYTQIWEVRRPVVSAITESGDEAISHQTELRDCPAHPREGAAADLALAKAPFSPSHMHVSKDGIPCPKDGSLSFQTFKPSGNHIYQSPKTEQKQLERCLVHHHADMVPFYFDLDPNMGTCERCENCDLIS